MKSTNLFQYELFASVAQTLNLSETAKQFYITQPAVSHHIKALETSLGVTLIKRTRRGIYLTDAGEELLPYIHEILSINSNAENRMKSIADGMLSHISLAVLSSSARIVSKCLVSFSQENPAVQVDINLLDGKDMVAALKSNDFDIYFALRKMVPVDSSYKELILKREKLAMFMNNNIAGDMKEIDWEKISRYPLISVARSDKSLYGKVMKIFQNHGYQPRVTYTYNRADATMLSVSAGIGVAILPASLEGMYSWSNVVALPIDDPEAFSEISCIWDESKLTFADSRFLNTVHSLYGNEAQVQ